MSAYTLVSLPSPEVAALGQVTPPPPATPEEQLALAALATHPDWDAGPGWKQRLNTLRLLLQPYVFACLLLPWLRLAPLPHLQAVQTGLAALGSLVNTSRLALPT